MTLDEYQKRPVYVVQCKTFKRALELLKVECPNGSLATSGALTDILLAFRVLPKYRNQYGKALRDMVALSVRMDRLKRRIEA